MLEERRRKKREKILSASFKLQNTLSTTVYLDNNQELSTALYTNDGVNYYDGMVTK